MLPIGPLMIEHRLIERMIAILEKELENIKTNTQLDPILIDQVVDFIRTYADQTHHGKEEDILFRELKKQDLSEVHEKTMNELIEEHVFARKTTGELVEAKNQYVKGNEDAIEIVIEKSEVLVDFYPKHIDKEDNHFFKPVMEYFSEEEQDALLKEGQIFDRRMIHRKYNDLVKNFEKEKNIEQKKQDSKWIEYL
jgi:hemerythrin-like domain-containing protein